jgi:CheY-like chemotaxis protein/anti-sigma regulatory factor (Ser/Thr protein kinase)
MDVSADRGRLRQILYNLVSNAIKFTPAGGRVSVEARRIDHEVRITVADTGVGIAPEHHELVFGEFQQVGDAASRQGGTGLGLALTRRLVEVHGGRVELESEPGRGSRFTVILPDAAVVPLEAPRSAESTATPDDAGGGILVIEDDPGAVRLLRTYLEGAGHWVRVCGDGASGLDEARRLVPSAILLDILLPGKDGWEVLRELKADPRLRDVPVVVATVMDERQLGLALGAVDYFLKPVDRDALLARLSRYTFTTKVTQGTVRVLVIDDDPVARSMVSAALEPSGFDVLLAASGREGIDRAREGGVHLVICDLVMPDLDGFEVVARLRADAATRELPILILTAHELTDADKERLNGHIVGVLGKGDPTEVRRELERWLERAIGHAPAAA